MGIYLPLIKVNDSQLLRVCLHTFPICIVLKVWSIRALQRGYSLLLPLNEILIAMINLLRVVQKVLLILVRYQMSHYPTNELLFTSFHEVCGLTKTFIFVLRVSHHRVFQ